MFGHPSTNDTAAAGSQFIARMLDTVVCEGLERKL
jgi:hypothetical protein